MLVTFLLCALMSSTPAAPHDRGSIAGRVVDQTGQPLPGASIELGSVLMLNGRDDFIFPVDRAQIPLLRALGTPDKDKRHILFEGGHVNLQTRMDLIGEILRWLDRYLGPVNTTS